MLLRMCFCQAGTIVFRIQRGTVFAYNVFLPAHHAPSESRSPGLGKSRPGNDRIQSA